MEKNIYAGFWLRLIAYIIDIAILSVVMAGVSQLLFIINSSETIIAVLSLVILWVYYASMESSHYQATVGKLAVGLLVTDENQKPISFGRATGRFFGKILSNMIFFIGHIMIAFTKKKQGLHDIIAGCLVLKKD